MQLQPVISVRKLKTFKEMTSGEVFLKGTSFCLLLVFAKSATSACEGRKPYPFQQACDAGLCCKSLLA